LKLSRAIVLTILLGLAFILPSCAGDPLTPAQRAWLARKGTIHVGVFDNYPTFGFLNAAGQPVGLSIDFWNLLAAKLHFTVQFYPAPFDDQLHGLGNGWFDSLAGIGPLTERRAQFDFSAPFYTINTCIYVTPARSGLKTLEDLQGLKVGVVEGDSSQNLAKEAHLTSVSFTTYAATVMALANGKVQAIILDTPVADYFIRKNGLQDKIRQIKPPVARSQMALPVKQGNAMLLGILNRGLVLITPEERQAIEKKWSGE
jgi:two-component system sensor histidine kinase/response regulator